MKKPSEIIDTVLTLIALFMFATIVCGYFTRNGTVTVAFSVVFAVCVTFFIGLFSQKRKAPAIKKKKLTDIMNKFVFSPQNYSSEFILNAIRKKHDTEENNGFIIAGKTAFCPKFTGEEISNAELARLYGAAAELGVKRLVIMSSHGADAKAAENLPLLCEPSAEIWDFAEVYDFLCAVGCEPTQTMKIKPRKKRFGAVFATALKRENARRYLFSAIVMLVSARFMPYAPLYIVFSSLSVVLAMLCLLRIPERFTALSKK